MARTLAFLDHYRARGSAFFFFLPSFLPPINITVLELHETVTGSSESGTIL